jgi:regulation of enolase protein 1 (concanavalin A-like superfamily)
MSQRLSSSDQSDPDGTVLCQGFDSLVKNNSKDPWSLEWYCGPDSWPTSGDSREGRDGAWELVQSPYNISKQLRLYPPAKKDFWRKTYYEPVLIKDDAPVAHVTLDMQKWYTITTSFTLTAVRQFDQAGLYIRIDSQHWIKAGIEVVDQKPRLSAVVTNVYSDWSTQSWEMYTTDKQSTIVKCCLRIHCRGESFVVEAKQDGDWEFVRIAHLSPNVVYPNDPIQSEGTFQGPVPPSGKLWAGVFAASPEDQRGAFVDFEDFSVVAGSSFEHNADGNS